MVRDAILVQVRIQKAPNNTPTEYCGNFDVTKFGKFSFPTF